MKIHFLVILAFAATVRAGTFHIPQDLFDLRRHVLALAQTSPYTSDVIPNALHYGLSRKFGMLDANVWEQMSNADGIEFPNLNQKQFDELVDLASDFLTKMLSNVRRQLAMEQIWENVQAEASIRRKKP